MQNETESKHGGMKGMQEVNTKGQERAKACHAPIFCPPPFEPSAQAHVFITIPPRVVALQLNCVYMPSRGL